jgi:hypothetical protein
MCTVLLPPGDNPIAVNKYIISYIRKMVCFRYIIVNTLHKRANKDDDNDDDNDNNNDNNNNNILMTYTL